MGRLVTFVLALCVIAATMLWALEPTRGKGSGSDGGRSSAARRLDNVRDAARRIQDEAHSRADQVTSGSEER